MKRNIVVKEKELIDRLNSRDRYVIGVDPANGEDKTVVTRWDNHGPVQFENLEEEYIKPEQMEKVKNVITKNQMKESAYKAAAAARLHSVSKNEDTQLRTLEVVKSGEKEQVNHPDHYNDYDVEVIEMMRRIFGLEATLNFCKLNAFKYRMRAGHKDGNTLEQDLKKERWYLDYIKNHKQ